MSSISSHAKEKLIWVTDDKTLPNICTSNRIKTEKRLKENLFSSPVNLFLSTRLYFLHETRYNQGADLFASLLNESGELTSFEALFSAFPEFVLGVSKGRSFGSALDNQLRNVSDRNLILRAGVGRYEALTKMLFKKRLDFIIQFPTEFKREIDRYSEELEVSSLAIAGNDQYIQGHIACSQSDFGENVIAQANIILRKLYQQASFYHAHSRYLSSADLIIFNQLYQEVYGVKAPWRLTTHE